MVVQCPVCLGRYRVVDESKVPPEGIGIKCPNCANIFTIYRIATDIELIPLDEPYSGPPHDVSTPYEPTAEPQPSAAATGAEPPPAAQETVFQAQPEPFEPRVPPEMAETATGVIPGPAEAVAPPTVGVEAELSAEDQKKHAKAKRLARVLVKDILLYHGDKVEEGLRNGNLVDMVGDEIKKSWQYYKSEMPEEIVNSTNYFKDALNSILARGKKIFT
ncbi:MAG: zinc-ribbon domain-containing protein [bacterium]